MCNFIFFCIALLTAQHAYADPICIEEDRATEVKLDDGIVVSIVEHAAIVDKGTWDLCNKQSVGLVNGDIPFGVGDPRPEFAKPFSYLKKLSLRIADKTYNLETGNMYNAWGNRYMDYSAASAHKAGVHMAAHCYDSANCTLRGIFSDAGGTYVAEWQILNGKSIRTLLSDSNDIVHHFMGKGIRPPRFE